MEALLKDTIGSAFFSQLFSFLLYGGGIFAVLKVIVWANSWRLFSFYYVWTKQRRFTNHEVFDFIEELLRRKAVSMAVKDPTKKAILMDMFEIELDKIRLILRMCLKKIIRGRFWDYVSHYPDFTSEKILDLFYQEYIANRDVVQSMARSRFKKFGASQDQFNRFWVVYQELSHDYESMMYSMSFVLRKEKDIFKLLLTILNNYMTTIEMMHLTMGNKFERLNGRLSGIFYKGDSIG